MTVTVVTGPPAGGKSTYVRERARQGDVVIDMDRIALALTSEDTSHHEYASHVVTVAVAARRAAIDTSLVLGDQVRVWIIDSAPTPDALARYQDHGAEIIHCDPGEHEVMRRINRERPARVKRVADRYYSGTLRDHSVLRW